MICSKKLNNNRAADYNLLTTEMVKYGPPQVHNEIKDILNQCLEKQEKIDVGSGLLVLLPKPNKVKGPCKNL